MTTPDHPHNNPSEVRPEVRPNFVPEGSPGIAETTSSPVPLSSIGDEVSQPARPRPNTSSRPWFQTDQIDWHYPDPNHPSTRDFPRVAQARQNPCQVCGAPPTAGCVTRTGNRYSGNPCGRGQR